jgi:DNA-binding transcriptional regulator GbsR (MarR family)
MNKERDAALKHLGSKGKEDSAGSQAMERETEESGKRAPSPAVRLIQSDGRNPSVVAFEAELVAFFIDAAEVLGVPKSVAAIYGICFASAEPLSFANIQERLRISQGSISQGIRVLKEIGALRVVGTHDRREYFAPEIELRRLATRFIEERLEKQLKAGKQRLQSIKTVVPDEDNSSTRELKARLSYLQTWHDKARGIIPLAKTFLKLT